jgi:hypothetical protein
MSAAIDMSRFYRREKSKTIAKIHQFEVGFSDKAVSLSSLTEETFRTTCSP